MGTRFLVLFLVLAPLAIAADRAQHTEVIGHGPAGALPVQFKAVVWNVEKSKQKTFASEYRKIAAGAQLVGLQEATTRKGLVGLTELATAVLPMQFQFVAPLKYGDEGFAGTATGTVVAAVSTRPLFSEDMEPQPVGTGKSSVITKYPIAGRGTRLLVANTHGMNVAGKFKFSLAPFERQINAVKREVAAHSGPVLWVGDFNTANKGKLAALHIVTENLGLKEVAFGESARLLKRGRVGGEALDRAFVRGIDVVNAKCVKTDGADHNALVLDLRVR